MNKNKIAMFYIPDNGWKDKNYIAMEDYPKIMSHPLFLLHDDFLLFWAFGKYLRKGNMQFEFEESIIDLTLNLCLI